MVSPHSPKTVRESEIEEFITKGSGGGTWHTWGSHTGRSKQSEGK